MKERLKKNQINFRVSDKEKEMILRKFKNSGFEKFKDYCCHMLTYGVIFKVDTEELERVSYEINKIGTNINQIAYKINLSGNIYENDIEEIKNSLLYLNNFLKIYFSNITKLTDKNNLHNLEHFFKIYFEAIKAINKKDKEMI